MVKEDYELSEIAGLKKQINNKTMQHEEFFKKQVEHGRSDHMISFYASVYGKEILLGDFVNLYRKIPRSNKGWKRNKSSATRDYKFLIKEGIIKQPPLI